MSTRKEHIKLTQADDGNADILAIVALDALTTIPFSRLRMQDRPKKFALIKVGGILINILATYSLISLLPNYAQTHPDSFLQKFYQPNWEVGYILIAGIVQNVFVLLLLKILDLRHNQFSNQS